MFSKIYSFTNENQKIKEQFSSAINVRVGGELISDEFRIRLGYAHFGSALNQGYYTVKNLLTENYLTSGFGIKKPEYFIDFGFSMALQKDFYVPYSLSEGSRPFYQSDMRFRNNRFMITLGLPID
jgi:hypothetical protein